jgi:hypothetical protein
MHSGNSASSSSSSSFSFFSTSTQYSITTWFAAIKNNKLDTVKAHVRSGFNARLVDPDNGLNALHYAIENINPSMVQFLLQQGFDLSKSERILLSRDFVNGTATEVEMGYLEHLLRTIGLEITNKALQNKEFSQETIIPSAERILDLLLCHGLKTDIAWTEQFEKGAEAFTEATDYQDARRQSHHRFRQTMSAMPQLMPANTFSEKGRKLFLSGVVGLLDLYFAYRFRKDKNTMLADYVQCVYEVKPKIYSEKEKIESQKQEKTVLYKNELQRFFAAGVDDIILNYSGDVDSDLAQSRIDSKECVRIWPK